MVGLRNRISIKSMLMHVKKRINKYYDNVHEKGMIFLHNTTPSILFVWSNQGIGKRPICQTISQIVSNENEE